MATDSGKTETHKPAGSEERSPEEIQADIEATRQELGDTVADIADKADVKKQAKRKVTETKAKAAAKKDEVTEKVTAQKDAAAAKVKTVAPESAQDGAQHASQAAQQAAAQATQTARENPVPTAALGAFAGGLVVGWLLGRR
jgi:ElaB/YqjD/DUF883 family membrane-anchored ribosome-binding protein